MMDTHVVIQRSCVLCDQRQLADAFLELGEMDQALDDDDYYYY